VVVAQLQSDGAILSVKANARSTKSHETARRRSVFCGAWWFRGPSAGHRNKRATKWPGTEKWIFRAV